MLDILRFVGHDSAAYEELQPIHNLFIPCTQPWVMLLGPRVEMTAMVVAVPALPHATHPRQP